MLPKQAWRLIARALENMGTPPRDFCKSVKSILTIQQFTLNLATRYMCLSVVLLIFIVPSKYILYFIVFEPLQ